MPDNTATRSQLLTELLQACAEGNLPRVNEILATPQIQAITPEEPVKYLNLALGTAVRSGHLNVSNRLLEIPYVMADAKKYNLEMAASGGHIEMLDKWLEIPAMASDLDGANLLSKSCRYRKMHMFNHLLDIPNVMEQIHDFEKYNLSETIVLALRYSSEDSYLSLTERLLKVPAIYDQVAKNSTLLLEVLDLTLKSIDKRMPLQDVRDYDGNVIDQARFGSLLDSEVNVVGALLKIAREQGIALELSETQRSIMDFCAPARQCLFDQLKRHNTLEPEASYSGTRLR